MGKVHSNAAVQCWKHSRATLGSIGPIDRARVCDLKNLEPDKPLSPAHRVIWIQWCEWEKSMFFESHLFGRILVATYALPQQGHATWSSGHCGHLGTALGWSVQCKLQSLDLRSFGEPVARQIQLLGGNIAILHLWHVVFFFEVWWMEPSGMVQAKAAPQWCFRDGVVLSGLHCAGWAWWPERQLPCQVAKRHVGTNHAGHCGHPSNLCAHGIAIALVIMYCKVNAHKVTFLGNQLFLLLGLPCFQEWWDHASIAGPKQREREPFNEPKPVLQVLCWRDGQTQLSNLVKFLCLYFYWTRIIIAFRSYVTRVVSLLAN